MLTPGGGAGAALAHGDVPALRAHCVVWILVRSCQQYSRFLFFQAEELGRHFRTVMYPRYGPAGGGLLRLHSTYRHDLKIYSSDEGRVQMSAAAFTQGLLDLEGHSLTPILVRRGACQHAKAKSSIFKLDT